MRARSTVFPSGTVPIYRWCETQQIRTMCAFVAFYTISILGMFRTHPGHIRMGPRPDGARGIWETEAATGPRPGGSDGPPPEGTAARERRAPARGHGSTGATGPSVTGPRRLGLLAGFICLPCRLLLGPRRPPWSAVRMRLSDVASWRRTTRLGLSATAGPTARSCGARRPVRMRERSAWRSRRRRRLVAGSGSGALRARPRMAGRCHSCPSAACRVPRCSCSFGSPKGGSASSWSCTCLGCCNGRPGRYRSSH